MIIRGKLKRITIEMIRSWDPCYSPTRHLPEGWSGTALDILSHPSIPDCDKLWVVIRESLMTESERRLFSVQCSNYAVDRLPGSELVDEIREVVTETNKVVCEFLLGNATQEELRSAESAAWSAARSATWSAARSAAESAARSAAWLAAESAARSAAESAAESAAWSAAESAAWSAAWSAAESAARSAQCGFLTVIFSKQEKNK